MASLTVDTQIMESSTDMCLLVATCMLQRPLSPLRNVLKLSFDICSVDEASGLRDRVEIYNIPSKHP